MSENSENQSNIWQKALEVLDVQVLAIIRESQFYHQNEKNIGVVDLQLRILLKIFLKPSYLLDFASKVGTL